MSYLNRLKEEVEKRQGGEPAKPSEAPSAPFAGRASGRFARLPPPIAEGLSRLPMLASPRLELPVWSGIVADALRLVTEGWADKALRLGWHPLDLWGAHIESPGLAVWLRGRRVVLLSGRTCTVEGEPGAYFVFTVRSPPEGSCFLWEYGRG